MNFEGQIVILHDYVFIYLFTDDKNLNYIYVVIPDIPGFRPDMGTKL